MVRVAIALLLFVLLPSVAQAEKRIAFVVGIDKYDNLAPQQQLQRAVNDARSVGAALAPLGFEVVSAENVGRAIFNAQWQKFLDKINPGDTAAVYFSGHGVEIEGLNFLLPRDVPNISFGRQEQLKGTSKNCFWEKQHEFDSMTAAAVARDRGEPCGRQAFST